MAASPSEHGLLSAQLPKVQLVRMLCPTGSAR